MNYLLLLGSFRFLKTVHEMVRFITNFTDFCLCCLRHLVSNNNQRLIESICSVGMSGLSMFISHEGFKNYVKNTLFQLFLDSHIDFATWVLIFVEHQFFGVARRKRKFTAHTNPALVLAIMY